jgi:hypothetical protein
MSSGELNFNGLLDLSRFMIALKYLDAPIKTEEIWHLAEQSRCGSVEEEEGDKAKFLSF